MSEWKGEERHQNSACHYHLSQIREEDKKLVFPRYFFDDYFCEYFEQKEIEPLSYDSRYYYVLQRREVVTKEILLQLKQESYSAIVWYDSISSYTSSSILLPLPNKDDIRKVLETALAKKEFQFPAFVKLDTVSCKDIDHNGIFFSTEEVVEAFTKSKRIQNTLEFSRLSHSLQQHHLFVREPDYALSEQKVEEYRCFVYHRSLVAVSGEKEMTKYQQQACIDYFKHLGKELPYQDAVVDIYLQTSMSFRVVEVNNFGSDSPAGSGEYSWEEDYALLHGCLNEVGFRFKKKYSF